MSAKWLAPMRLSASATSSTGSTVQTVASATAIHQTGAGSCERRGRLAARRNWMTAGTVETIMV